MAKRTRPEGTTPGKKGKKPPSAARVAAMAAVEAAAKGSPERSLAYAALKALKFREIVVPRVNRALKMLDGIEKMSNTAAYKWEPDHGAKIAKALDAAVNRIAVKLSGAKVERESFSL